MSTINALGLLLLVLMLVVSGWRGARSFISLLLNFCLFFLDLALVAFHFNPLIVTAILGICILAITIFMATDDLTVGKVSFLTSLIITAALFLFVWLIEYWAQVPGFATEDSDELEGMSVMIGINYYQVALAITILSVLGAIAEAAMAVTTGVAEMMATDPDMSRSSLLAGGLQVGRQIIGTTLNTLFFGFFGGLLALLVWFGGLNYSWGTIINNKIFAAQFITVLLSVIGVCLCIPLSTWLAAHYFGQRLDKSSPGD